MTLPRPPVPATPSAFLRACLARTVRHGGRELRLGPEAIALDGLGRPFRLERDGVPVAPDLAALSAHMSQGGWHTDERHRHGEVEFEGLGSWTVRTAADGALALRAKRPPAACLEALFEATPGEYAALRGLYRHGGVDIRVSSEGETRAREVALTLTAERLMLGLPTRTVLGPTPEQRYRQGSILPHDGNDPFDGASRDLPGWLIEVPSGRQDERAAPSPVGAPTRAHVTSGDRYHGNLRGDDPLASVDFPAAVVRIEIVSSRAVARIHLSPSARALSAASAPFPDAPWDVQAARRAARLQARPPKPRTWHQTTFAVAEAFVAREAPRGFVSGYPVFFHGPVAYSLSDDNPVAAFVETADGRPLLLTGRSIDFGGTKAGTVTSALGDIRHAAKGLRMIDVDDLAPLVRLGGLDLRRIPPGAGRDKAEANLPRDAAILPEALSAWVARSRARMEAELDKAYGTRFATQRQANAYHALAHLCETRAALSTALGLDLPEAGDPADLRRRTQETQEAADLRQRDLADRERLRKAAEPPRAPGP